jgi:hypothetical protein
LSLCPSTTHPSTHLSTLTPPTSAIQPVYRCIQSIGARRRHSRCYRRHRRRRYRPHLRRRRRRRRRYCRRHCRCKLYRCAEMRDIASRSNSWFVSPRGLPDNHPTDDSLMIYLYFIIFSWKFDTQYKIYRFSSFATAKP